jgi:hypothetical protein
MTYLELVNAVLVRLREKKVSAVDTNPFVSVIGAFVNDAKDSVEDAWQWSQLRGNDALTVNLGVKTLVVPDSADTNYQIKSILNIQTGNYLKYVVQPWMRGAYRNSFNTPVPNNEPMYWTWGNDDDATGNKTIDILSPSNGTYNFLVNRVKHQAPLVNPSDRLKVPSQPVIQLATALASRERGEIGGAPTSELFILADRYLSDAIAYDTTKWENEMDWYAGSNMQQTNVNQYV